jgi:aminoglycoside/choline kinase family phosphotransferase
VTNALSLWLSTVLPTARRFRLQPLAEAASFRRFYRLQMDGDTAIAMLAPPPREDAARFVRLAHLFRRADVPVPRILAHDHARGFALMEDLGGRRLEDAYREGHEAQATGIAIEHLHVLQRLDAGLLPPYTAARLADELELFRAWYVLGRRRLPMYPQWPRVAAELVRQVASQPVSAVHRDYHCQNLLLDDSGRFGVVDFQDALAGPALYDLASLLHDCYHHFSDADIDRHLDRYLEGAPFAFDDARLQLDLTGLQRQLKALGIFARLSLRDGRNTHLRYIAPVLQHAAHTASRYPWLTDFSAWLAELAEAERQ